MPHCFGGHASVHLVKSCGAISDVPVGWATVHQDMPVHAVAGIATPASSLPPGSYAVAAGTDGQLRVDVFAAGMEAYGTTVGMVCSESLKILARRHKASMLSQLGMEGMHNVKAMLAGTLQLWGEEQRIQRDAAAEVERAEERTASSVGASTSAAEASTLAPAQQPSTLENAPFDTMVSAFLFLDEHKHEIEFEFEFEAKDGGEQSTEEVLEQLQTVFHDVVTSEGGSDGVPAGQLLDEWRAAHDIRQQRNTTAAHPLANMDIANEVLDVLDAATTAGYPLLCRIPHLAHEAIAAAREHVQHVLSRVHTKRSTQGKMKLRM